MPHHLMLIPSLACQAQCTYCFGPNHGPAMPSHVLDATLDWIESFLPPEEGIELTFHGGEPLLVGRAWYQRALPLLRARLGDRVKLHMQSNLWRLEADDCALFKEYGVSIGTSLDGPQAINDRQRGEGYYARTMAGIELARRNGLDVGVICTFTRLSAPHYRTVCEFFSREHLSFSVHAAVATLDGQPAGANGGLAMSPDEHADLLCDLFDHYLESVTRLRISTFDAMARGISTGTGGICTFGNCLGHYLTVGPRGRLYTCNRFVAHPQWQVGSVFDRPNLATLSREPAWRRLSARELRVQQACGDCPHSEYCRGGCAYNAVTARENGDGRDPHCPAYRRLFDRITERAMDEVFSEENLDAVVEKGPGHHGLLHKGRLLQIMRGGPHPQQVARRAREIVAAVALAASPSPEAALGKLDRAGLITRPELALGSLRGLRERLDAQPQISLLNAYLHVMYYCNLHCKHCYANSGPDVRLAADTMAVEDVARLVRQAAEAGFRKAVITGGEPVLHPQRDALLDRLAALRQEVAPLEIVLRTNLAYPLSPALAGRLICAANQVVVSVDGDEASHAARRGAGTYGRTVENLRVLAKALGTAAKDPCQLGITAVLPTEQTAGPEGEAVRALGEDLGARVRFKSVLPLGRGADLELTPDPYSSLDDGAEAVAYGARPVATCGLGINLYVAPDGACWPCYALMGKRHRLGNALDEGLVATLARNDAYRRVTVDSNQQCRRCALRYLCGGFCRAWGNSDDPDAPPVDCTALHERARGKLLSALEALNVPTERWRAAGLPLPDHPPD